MPELSVYPVFPGIRLRVCGGRASSLPFFFPFERGSPKRIFSPFFRLSSQKKRTPKRPLPGPCCSSPVCGRRLFVFVQLFSFFSVSWTWMLSSVLIDALMIPCVFFKCNKATDKENLLPFRQEVFAVNRLILRVFRCFLQSFPEGPDTDRSEQSPAELRRRYP